MKHLSPRLREIVFQSVAILGEVIQTELGAKEYARIERLRQSMADLRTRSSEETYLILKKEMERLRRLSADQQLHVARAFTLMLELMNTCENAYRSHEIRRRILPKLPSPPKAVIYVLTAHPTEARSPENMWVFQEILHQLAALLEKPEVTLNELERLQLRHALEIAWKAPIIRGRRPRVEDEAAHIYSTLLRDESLRTILSVPFETHVPVYVRSWVGGDKDGHPGVTAAVFLASLRLSRQRILEFVKRRLREVKETLTAVSARRLIAAIHALELHMRGIRSVDKADAEKIEILKTRFRSLLDEYEEWNGVLHPSLVEMKRLFHVFPALVVPLEFRESSDVLMSSPSGKGLTIFAMLKSLEMISRGGDPRWYVRGLIVSMTSEPEHLATAAKIVEKALGDLRLPVIPLFEQIRALQDAPRIVREILHDRKFQQSLRRHWGGQFEVMLGYSDSSKESGVLRSRLQVAESMYVLEKVCEREGAEALFFQGSGGSTDRGGGSVAEQTAWWSSGALKNYKVTIQGEMVERSLANAEITRGQIERITQSAGRWKEVRYRSLPRLPVVDRFAEEVSRVYQDTVHSEGFLSLIEQATPYPFLDRLKLGSRPSKRARQIDIQSLRAIPWILCWTQTRVLFPTWWGVGRVWRSISMNDRRELIAAASGHPLFKTYVRALGYTLAKVELPVWRVYLDATKLPENEKEEIWSEFTKEYQASLVAARALLQSRQLISWRPWLQESITLRSPMIHPLNMLQVIAMENRHISLLRVTVTGISSGMMTTG